jgi:uridine kinase
MVVNDIVNYSFTQIDDIRLCKRVLRDVKERGREVDGVLYQYNKYVRRSFEDFIKPTINFTDIIVPGSREN